MAVGKFNVFEGSRRIALLIAGAAVVAAIFFAATYQPFLSVRYEVKDFGEPVKHMAEGAKCPDESAYVFLSDKRLKNGGPVHITLCLHPKPSNKNSGLLIPYKVDSLGFVWGGGQYSADVRQYGEGLAKTIVISDEIDRQLTKEWRKQYLYNAMTVGIGLVVGVCLWALFVFITGWVVRGFLGIPRGMDQRPPE